MWMGKRAVLLLTVVAAMLLAFSGVVLAQSTQRNPEQDAQASKSRVNADDTFASLLLTEGTSSKLPY
jgi:hypothetical protein